MKRSAVLIAPLLLALSAQGGIAAFAEAGDTIYPDNGDFVKALTFTSLTDYAVDGETYAFADGNTVLVYGEGNLTEYEFEEKVEKLDYSDGILYYSTVSGTFTLPDSEKAEYQFGEEIDLLRHNGFIYDLNDGELTAYNSDTHEHTPFEGVYSDLKVYGEKLYALGGNVLYSINGAEATEISLEYADFTATQKICIGNSPAELKKTSLKFVEVEAGTYMTEVDLTSLDGDFFTAGKTLKTEEKITALFLCNTGNASIIAIGDTSYILLQSKTKATEVECYVEKEFDNATVIGNRIYATPYVIIGTSSVSNAAGMIVSVLNKLEYDGVLGSAFYEVMYMTEDKTTHVGYVADGFLTEYIIEDNNDPNIIPDPGHSEKNNTKTVVLILIVVILVLIAVGYLLYIATSDKRKKNKKQQEKIPEDKT